MTTVQLPAPLTPGRGGPGGTRDSPDARGASRSASAFGTVFSGHLTGRQPAPGVSDGRQRTSAEASPVTGGAAGAGERPAPSGRPVPGSSHSGPTATGAAGAAGSTGATGDPSGAPAAAPFVPPPSPTTPGAAEPSEGADAEVDAVDAPNPPPGAATGELPAAPDQPDAAGEVPSSPIPASGDATSSTDDAADMADAAAPRSADQPPAGAPAAAGPPAAPTTPVTGTGTPVQYPPIPGVPPAAEAPVTAVGSSSESPTAGPGAAAQLSAVPRDTRERTAGPDTATRTLAGEPGTAVARTDAVAVPAQQAPVSSAPQAAAPTPVAAHPVRPPAPLPQQLGARAFALVQSVAATDGRASTITVAVAPDDLGPVTIRATLSAEGARLEFFSATDGGREALRQALPELRREAASSGLSAALDLGAGTPEDHGRERFRDEHRPVPLHPEGPVAPGPSAPWAGRSTTGSSTLDLLA